MRNVATLRRSLAAARQDLAQLTVYRQTLDDYRRGAATATGPTTKAQANYVWPTVVRLTDEAEARVEAYEVLLQIAEHHASVDDHARGTASAGAQALAEG